MFFSLPQPLLFHGWATLVVARVVVTPPPLCIMDIEIRLCKTWDECLQCEELQKNVWEMPDYRDAVPANFLITAIKNGGLLVGAFRGDEMVGFAFGFLGSESDAARPDGRHLKHTSHMLAVVPDARTKGLGAQLKWFQRDAALAQGLDLMTWTYDPLQAVNAHLNLTRLGAVARRYYRNAYGDMTDALNVGLASDRFEVEWWLDSARVRAAAPPTANAPQTAMGTKVYSIEWNSEGFPLITAEDPLVGDTLWVEIPAEINTIKAGNLALAIQWRERTRSTFERAFAAGYIATGLVAKSDTDGRTRVWYVLTMGLALG